MAEKELTVSTWNIAAINNNPWEYWITYDGNPKYTQLMVDIEQFIENPQEKDIPVSQIFTQEMFETLVKSMEKEGWTGLEEVRKHWTENYQHRKIISEFMKDSTIGNKRLASMPDRITNTINIIQQEGDNENFVCRPTIINQYEGDLSTTELWFNQWLKFLFEKEITIKTRKGIEKKKISSLLMKIEHSKYPAITPEEEEISIPLQTLCIAIFDCILVHMLNLLAKDDWQPIKTELTSSLNKRKVQRTCEIIEEKYSSSDIVFLQEVASAFISQSKTFFSNDYQNQITILHPENVDYSRDQNSMMILKNNRFDLNSRKEVTEDVIKYLSNLSAKKVPLVAGDLFALTIHSTTNQKYFLASFHGDTDGLATLPVLSAIDQFLKEFYPDYSLIFGLDANTYEKSHPSRQGVVEFSKEFTSRGITSCFGDSPNPANYTTFNARTYLQTQLNKACKSTEIKAKGDVNPKDFILFYSKDFHSNEWLKDNTGNRNYVDDIVYPTLTFPSDHAVLTAVLHQRIESKI